MTESLRLEYLFQLGMPVGVRSNDDDYDKFMPKVDQEIHKSATARGVVRDEKVQDKHQKQHVEKATGKVGKRK